MKKQKKSNTVTATCVSCGRNYWATEAYVRKVIEGSLESLCGMCDHSHEEEK